MCESPCYPCCLLCKLSQLDGDRFAPEAFAAASVAASEDLHSMLGALLSGQLVPIERTDTVGRSLLHLATRRGAAAAVAVLLRQEGVMVNLRACGADGATALHHAAAAGQLEITEQLLSAAADPNVITSQDGYSCLHYAALSGGSALVQALVDADARVDMLSLSGATPLHCAALSGALHSARTLLKAKVCYSCLSAALWCLPISRHALCSCLC